MDSALHPVPHGPGIPTPQTPQYCSNINGFMSTFKVQHIAENWRLFIDSSKRSIKAVLLHNRNKYA